MRALIVGGTGMLGYPTALELLGRGYRVEATARHAVNHSPPFDQVRLHQLDVSVVSDADLSALMAGVDALVYALGPDDRETPPAPASAYFQRHLVEQTARVLNVARRSGVKRAVVLGSYFCTFHRQHPEWKLTGHHAYVAARVEQAAQAIAAGQGRDHQGMDVMILEIPYVFGVTPGRTPFWKAVLFERLRRMQPVILYPRGGTVALTTTQLAQAVAGALEHGQHGMSYPVGAQNLTWNELIGVVQDTLGQRKPLLNVPPLVAWPFMQREKLALKRAGKESGIEPLRLLPDFMSRHLYLDYEPVQRALGITPGRVEDALRETVRASYPELTGGARRV